MAIRDRPFATIGHWVSLIKNLSILTIVGELDRSLIQLRRDWIHYLKKKEARDKDKPKIKGMPDYKAPEELFYQKVTTEKIDRTRAWTTYKYYAGYRTAQTPHKLLTNSDGEDRLNHKFQAQSKKRKGNTQADETHKGTHRPSKRNKTSGAEPQELQAELRELQLSTPWLTNGKMKTDRTSRTSRRSRSQQPTTILTAEVQPLVNTRLLQKKVLEAQDHHGKYAEEGKNKSNINHPSRLLPNTSKQNEEEEVISSLPRYTPSQFLAERTTPTPNGTSREILVRWENFPEEKDWTWESETTLQEDVPDMVEAWMNRRRRRRESITKAEVHTPPSTKMLAKLKRKKKRKKK